MGNHPWEQDSNPQMYRGAPVGRKSGPRKPPRRVREWGFTREYNADEGWFDEKEHEKRLRELETYACDFTGVFDDSNRDVFGHAHDPFFEDYDKKGPAWEWE